MTPRGPLLAAALLAGLSPAARADRLGGNFRGPGDLCEPRDDPPPAGDPFLPTLEAGRRETAFSGRPLLVFFALPGCTICGSVADGTLRDAGVADLASRFVCARADAEREEAFGLAHRVRTIPTILLLAPDGTEIGRAEGEVGPAETAAALRLALRKAGSPRPTRAALDLAKAAAALDRALQTKDWKAVLAAAAAIEKIGHEGPALDGARAAKKEAADEADLRLAAAKQSIRNGKKDEARRALARIALEFPGLDEAVEAANLIKEMDGPGPGNGGGGGTGVRRDLTVEERLARAEGDLHIPLPPDR